MPNSPGGIRAERMTELHSTLLCPSCGAASEEVMPEDACVWFWTCPECRTRHRPKDGDCCVFCSYGSEPCPPVQDSGCLDCADASGGELDCADPAVLQALRVIPGVGQRVARDLWDLGIRGVEDLRGRDPEALYDRLCEIQGTKVDRCMLYTLRCAIYFASTEEPEPELLKWWAWKDR